MLKPRGNGYNSPVLAIRRLLQDVIDLCYPGLCAGCKAECRDGDAFCPGCLEGLRALEEVAACVRCGGPLATPEAPCPFCQGRGLSYYKSVHRLATFTEPLKGLIHQAKYSHRWGLAELLAERLCVTTGVRELLCDADVLVPVPLHFLRQFRRGYNQAEVIARHISRHSGTHVARAISRVRHTQSQTHLTRRGRFQNVRQAFKLLDARPIAGRHVVVIDDVMTTGATLKAVARVLRRARPASISALLLAVADPRGRDFRAV